MKSRLTYSESGSKIPAYVPAYEDLYNKISSGAYAPNDQLEPETVLANRYGISRGSLRQALAILREDGMIYNVQGKGNFVRKNICRALLSINELRNPVFSCALSEIEDEQLYFNYQPTARVVQEKLHLTPLDIALTCNAVYCQNGSPVAHAFYSIPVNHLTDISLDLNDSEDIKNLLEEGIYKMAASSEARMFISNAEEDIAKYLQVPVDTPLLFIEEVLFGPAGDSLFLCKYYLLQEYYRIQMTRK